MRYWEILEDKSQADKMVADSEKRRRANQALDDARRKRTDANRTRQDAVRTANEKERRAKVNLAKHP